MNKKKLLFISIFIYLFGILSFFLHELKSSREIIYNNIDAKLRSAAISLDYIVPDRIHYLAKKHEKINPATDRYNTLELSRYAKELGVKYLYSFVLIDGKVYYTASSATDKEIEKGDVYIYMYQYPEATEELKNLFKTPNAELIETAKDSWGYFRSILKSHVGHQGQIYVTGADIEISSIRKTFIISFLKSILLAMSLLIIFIPVLIQYERINKLQIDNSLNEDRIKKIEYDENTGLPFVEKLWVDDINYNNPNIFIIGINNLKAINTHYGQELMEKMLKHIAFLLSNMSIINSNYRIYKLGLEEFVLVIDEKNSYEDLNLLSENIFEEIYNKPIILDKMKIIINPIVASSVTLEENRNNLKNIFLSSRIALNYAYEYNLRFFVSNTQDNKELATIENEILWTGKLWDAINEDRVKPFFQGILNVNTGKVEKYESLMRIYENDGKILSPFAFLGISHKTGLYFKLSENMIKNSFKFFHDKSVEFSINISPKDINDENIKKTIIKRVKNFPNPQLIIFEIIESEGIDNFDEITDFLESVKKMGCKIALDDFGSGYSNFERISKLPLDYIKIDGSLIKTVDTNKNHEILVQMIVKISKKMGVKTVAEFVHSESVYKKIKELGIDFAQGYYISEPLPKLLDDEYSIEE